MQIEAEGFREENDNEKAMAEAGRMAIVDSLTVAREFNRFMVGVAPGGLAGYIGLLSFALGDNYSLERVDAIAMGPSVLFFFAAVAVFAIGAFPWSASISLTVPGDVAEAREVALRRRRALAIIGFVLLGLGTLAACLGLLHALSL